MTVWSYSLVSVVIVSLLSLLGVFALLLQGDKLQRITLFLVSFAVGGLLGDAVIHLIPESFEKMGGKLAASLYVLAGMLGFFLLEKYILWHHFHVHAEERTPGRCCRTRSVGPRPSESAEGQEAEAGDSAVPIADAGRRSPSALAAGRSQDGVLQQRLKPIVPMILLGDSVHNFIDGAVIGASYVVSIPLGVATTLAVVLHELPHEIGDFGVLVYGGVAPRRALLLNFLTALTAIAGTVASLVISPHVTGYAVAVVPLTAGGFIYIAASDLIPELQEETRVSRSVLQLLLIVCGVGIMALLVLLE